MSHTIYLGLGTNLGDRLANLQSALTLLRAVMSVTHASSVYETAAWGYTEQPNFLNLCVSAETSLTPDDLLNTIKTIEADIGRKPTKQWGPRLIDIDILLYADRSLNEQHLVIPHPFLAQRAFVLVPLAEIAPDVVHPTKQMTIAKLSERIDSADVTLYQEAAPA